MSMSPEAQYQLAMKMPEASLASILKGIPGDIDQSVAMMVLNQRRKMKIATQGQQAAKQAEEPNVKDRMLQSQQAQLPENQGIGTLPSPNMGQVAAMAQGGVVGFKVGGTPDPLSQPESKAGMVWDSFKNRWVDTYSEPFSRFMEYGRVPNNPELSKAKRRVGELAPEYLESLTPEERTILSQREEQAKQRVAQLQDAQSNPLGSTRFSPTAPAANAAAPAPAPAPAPAAPPPASRGRAAPPAPASQGGIGVLGAGMFDAAGDANDRAMVAPADAPDAAPAAGLTALMPPSAAPARVSASKVYSDQMTEALKALTSTPEEKDKQKDERLGVMALQAASALLQPGTTGAGARSAVFGKMAALTQQYGKEDREDKRAAIGAKISVLGAQMNNANQQEQNAITLENHAGDTIFRYADLAAKTAQNKAENDAKQKGLSLEEQKIAGTLAYQKEHLQVIRDNTASHERVGMAQARATAGRGTTLTPSQYAAASAKAAKAVDDRLKNPGELFKIKKDPAFKDFTDTQIRDALIAAEMQRSMPGAEVGSGIGTPKTSIQRDNVPGKLNAASDPDLKD